MNYEKRILQSDSVPVFRQIQRQSSMQSASTKKVHKTPRQMPANVMKNSDRSCCYTCNNLAYDMDRRTDFCKVTNKPTKPWNDCICNAHEWTRTAGE